METKDFDLIQRVNGINRNQGDNEPTMTLDEASYLKIGTDARE